MPKIQVWTLFWTLPGKKLSGDHADARSPEFCPGVIWVLSCFFSLDYLRHNIARSALALSEVMTVEKGISRQLKQGLYREYVPMQEDLSVMRGKLNMGDTIRLKVQQNQKLSCEFDEFSEDNLYNQILKVTIHRLIRAKDVAPERKQALKKLIIFFGNVKLIQPDHIAWNRLIYQRNNRNYELLLNICYLVLKHLLQTTDDGQYKLIEFSDEQMNLLR